MLHNEARPLELSHGCPGLVIRVAGSKVEEAGIRRQFFRFVCSVEALRISGTVENLMASGLGARETVAKKVRQKVLSQSPHA